MWELSKKFFFFSLSASFLYLELHRRQHTDAKNTDASETDDDEDNEDDDNDANDQDDEDFSGEDGDLENEGNPEANGWRK